MATRFENFSGTTEAGKKETDEFVEVRTSEAAKRDAAPVKGKHFETVVEEYERLKREKSVIEAELSGYSHARMLKEQSQIRRQFHGPASLEAWINRKNKLEHDRHLLVKKKQAIEMRLGVIKEKVRDQKKARISEQESARWQGPMLELLIEIRDELRAIRNDWGGK